MKEIGSLVDELIRLSRGGFPLIEIDEEFNFIWNPTSRIARSSKFKLRGTGGKEAFVYDPHTDTITISAGVVGIPSSVAITDLTVADFATISGLLTADGGLNVSGLIDGEWMTVDALGNVVSSGFSEDDFYTKTEVNNLLKLNQVQTAITELIDVSSLLQDHYIEQTATPIDTTFTKAVGSKIYIFNNTAGTNTFDGQDIYTGEGISAIWNGTQWNWV